MKNKVVAFVHAKSTSTRTPGKNMRLLGDKPLFVHALTNALEATGVDLVVIDSDDEKILNIGSSYGATPLKRPVNLATNETSGDILAFWQASNYSESDIVLQVVPTSPFIRPETISEAIELMKQHNKDSVVGVHSEPLYEWKDGRPNYFSDDGSIPNSFEMDPVVYETTGLYVNKTSFVLSSRKRLNPMSCTMIELSKIESVDINTPDDFHFAEIILKGIDGNK